MKSLKFITTLISSILILFATTSLSFAKVVGDTIVLGSAISLTGKYATNGEHTQRGYDLGVKIINDAGGVKVGGKTYKLDVKYYDDESNSAKAAALAQRLIEQDADLRWHYIGWQWIRVGEPFLPVLPHGVAHEEWGLRPHR